MICVIHSTQQDAHKAWIGLARYLTKSDSRGGLNLDPHEGRMASLFIEISMCDYPGRALFYLAVNAVSTDQFI